MAIQDYAVIAGDSTADYNSQISNHGSTNEGWDFYRSGGIFVDMTVVGQESWTPDFANYYYRLSGRVIGTFNIAFSGTRLAFHWDPAQSTAYLDSTIYGLGNFFTTAGNPSIALDMYQLGANDVTFGNSALTATDYKDVIGRIQTWVAAHRAGAPDIWFAMPASVDPTPFTGGASNADYITRWNRVRQGILDAYDAGYCRPGPNFTGEVYADRTHPSSTAIAARMGRAWALAKYSNLVPPRMSSVAISTVDGDAIRVRIDANLSSALASSVGGFRVTDDSGDNAITGATVTGTRAITLALDRVVDGTALVSFGYSADAEGATVPLGDGHGFSDSTTYYPPLLPFFEVAAAAFTPGSGISGARWQAGM